MKKYIVKHSLSCDELGLKQENDIFETNNEELVARLGNLIEEYTEIEAEDTTEDKKKANLPDPTKPVGENEGNDLSGSNSADNLPAPAADDLETKTLEDLMAIAKEKDIKGNLKNYKKETLIAKIREIK